MMTKESLAKLLQGREYHNELTDAEETEAENAGLVVVTGYSDDNMELRGAIQDEFSCYEGGECLIDADGLLPDRETALEDDDDEAILEYLSRSKKASKITVLWCPNKGGEVYASWAYLTDIPHVKFEIMEDSDVYCEGIVFDIKDLAK